MTAVPDTAPPDAAGAAGTRWTPRLWAMLLAVCAAFMLDALDNIMVGIATPPIEQEFAMSSGELQWVVSAYVLSFGGFLLLGGRLSDLLGRRRVFVAGVALFALGSLVGGLATSGEGVILGRFVMGAGAALTAPAALSIIVTTFTAGPQRNRALGIYTACGAIGYTTGVVVGGLLTELGWRWTFLLPVPVALLALAGALLLVPRDPARTRRGSYDVAGAVLVTGGMLLLVYAIVEAPVSGLFAPRTVGALGAAMLALAAFVLVERRAADPLLRLGLLRVRSLVGATLAAAAILGTYMSFQFIAGLYLQNHLGWSPLGMGLAFLPVGLLIAVIAPRAGVLIGRFGVQAMIAAGFIAYTLAYVLFLRIDDTGSYLLVVLPSVALIGLAFPLAFPAVNALATSGVPDAEQGRAAGVLQTGYQVGAAVMLAVVAATLSTGHGAGSAAGLVLDDYRAGVLVILGVAAVAALAATLVALRSRRD